MEMELEFSSFWGGGWGENLQYHTEEKKRSQLIYENKRSSKKHFC